MTPISDERIFITGGAGFIGAWTCSRLAPANRIVVYDCLRRNALQHSSAAGHPHITVVRGDVLDREHLAQAMREAAPTIVIHLAAITGVPNYTRMPIQTIRTNVEGTAHALECAAEHELKRFINFSTSEVYGSEASDASEDSPTSQGPVGRLRWSYAVSKITAEHLSIAYHRRQDLPVVSLRPFNIYGPLQVGEGAVRSFIEAALEGRPLPLHGDGSQVRAWCYVEDLIDALELAIQCDDAVGEVFNIGNPDAALTIRELAALVLDMIPSASQAEDAPATRVDIHMRTPCIDKARRILGFEPRFSLREGLERTIAWYRRKMAAQGETQA